MIDSIVYLIPLGRKMLDCTTYLHPILQLLLCFTFLFKLSIIPIYLILSFLLLRHLLIFLHCMGFHINIFCLFVTEPAQTLLMSITVSYFNIWYFKPYLTLHFDSVLHSDKTYKLQNYIQFINKRVIVFLLFWGSPDEVKISSTVADKAVIQSYPRLCFHYVEGRILY